MVEEDYTDEFEDYESMEAEAEELSKKQADPRANQAQKQQVARQQEQVQPVAQRGRGRPPKIQQEPEPQQRSVERMSSKEEQFTDKGAAAAQPKWVAYHQPDEIGIINLETRETIKGFKDEGSATAQAKILNELNTLIVSGGYQ